MKRFGAIYAIAALLLSGQVRHTPAKPRLETQAITLRYFPQRSVDVIWPDKPGGSAKVKLGGFSTSPAKREDRENAVTASGKFVYVSAGSYAYITQNHVGPGGILQPMKPEKLNAHSHPTSISFHPSGRFLYVACSHGAICVYGINPNGTLGPVHPLEVYGENDPSPLRFDKSGHYACVVTDRVGGGEQLDVYRVLGNGTLKLDRRLAADNIPVNAKSIIVKRGEVVVSSK